MADRTATADDSQEDVSTSPYDNHGHRHLGVALALIGAAQLMVVLDATIVNIAMPKLRVDLGFTDTSLTWVFNAYTLAFAGLLLVGGKMGDILGRRRVFMFGITLFAVASFVGGLSTTSEMLLASRAAQGIGAAIASPTALSLITTTFPPGPPRNKAFSVYAAMSGVGAAVGLILGGFLVEQLSWRWTFFVNVPIGLLVAFLAPKFLGKSVPQHGRIDIPGVLTGTFGLVLLVYGLTHAANPTGGWNDSETIVCLSAAALLLAAFVVIESKVSHPMLPLRILADRNRGVTYAVMLTVGMAMASLFFFLGLFIQEVMDYSPLKAGVCFLPFSAGVMVSAQVASRLASRVDPRYLAMAGCVVAGTGIGLFSQLESGSSYWPHVLVPMLVASLGMGLIFVPLTLTAISRIPHEDSGVASGVLNTTQQVGSALGLAVLLTLVTSAITAKMTELTSAAQRAMVPGAPAPTPEQLKLQTDSWIEQAQTAGYTRAFLVGGVVIVACAVIAFVGLTIKHEELSSDHDAVGVG